MIQFYVKAAIRNLRKFKEFSVLNILGLAVGMTCTILITLWAVHELSYENFFSNSERIYMISTKNINSDSRFGNYYTPYAISKQLTESFPEIISYTRWENYSQFSSCMLKKEGDTESEKRLFYENSLHLGDTSFFTIFDFPFVYGNRENAFKEINSMVLAENTAKKYFGDKNPVGETLIYNNEKPFIVTGVVDMPNNTQMDFDVVIINESVRDPGYLNGWDSNGPAFVMLDEGIQVSQIRDKVYRYLMENENPLIDGIAIELVPLNELHTMYGLKILITIILSLTILILTIACLNYINLSTALFSRRNKQVALTRISGAFKSSVTFQLITESIIITLISLGFSLILVQILLPFFNQLTSTELSLDILGPAPVLILYLLSFGLLIGLISGMYPAIRLSSRDPLSLVRRENEGTYKGAFGRKFMVVFQFLLSIFLITSTLFILKQRMLVERQPLGFDKDYIIRMSINEKLRNRFADYHDALLQNPNVLGVTAASTVPSEIGNHSPIRWGPGEDEIERNCKFAIVMPGYLKTFNIDLVEGEPFDFDKPSRNKGYIINELAAERIGQKPLIGKTINFWGRDGEVIGIIKDFQNNRVRNEPLPLVLSALPNNHFFLKYVFIKINPASVKESISFIKNTTASYAPDYPFEYSFIDEEISNYFRDEARFNKIFLSFSVIAVLIALLGVFGMVLFNTEKRTKEIGVRKVNGAAVGEIMQLVSRELVECISLGFIFSIPLVYLLMKSWLKTFAYQTALSWWVFMAAGGIAVLMAFITVSWHTYRAARRNPVEALRYE